MRTVVTLTCVSLCVGWLAMALDLPVDILTGQYLLEATEALEQGDPQTVAQAFEKIKALALNEEENAWYQAEIGIMEETPLPRVEVIAHADENLGRSPAGDWEASGQGGQIIGHRNGLVLGRVRSIRRGL